MHTLHMTYWQFLFSQIPNIPSESAKLATKDHFYTLLGNLLSKAVKQKRFYKNRSGFFSLSGNPNRNVRKGVSSLSVLSNDMHLEIKDA